MPLILSGSLNMSGSLQATVISIPGGGGIVSSSTQIQNYNLFAQTSSANTFYGNQTITGSLFISGSGGNPSQAIQIIRDTLGNGTTVEESNMALTILSAPGQTKLAMGASNAGNYGYIQAMQDATSWNNRSLTLQPRGGDVTISNGNLIIGTSGKGIDFSATSNGSGTTNSELLNDYEEGTWTPVLKGSTTAGTYTYDTDRTNGKYVKIGKQVFLQGVFRVDTVTSAGSGNALVSGIPFAPVETDISWDRTLGNLAVQSGTTLPSASLLSYTQGNSYTDSIGLGYRTMEGWNQLDVTTVDEPNAIWWFSITYMVS